jgi:peptide/nickel transport system substrate-binding protein
MLPSLNRRRFLQALGAGALVLSRAIPARAATQGDRLVVAVGQWGIETPFAWRSSQSEKTLWDCVYDPLIMRDPKTFEYRPGLATDWQPSADYKSWTFHLREGIKFHEDWGELTGEDVKFTSNKPAARCPGWLSAVLPQPARPYRATRAVHGGHAF